MKKKPHMRTPEEKRSLLATIDADIKAGSAVIQAVKAQKIDPTQYYKWKKDLSPGKDTKNKKKSPSLVNIPFVDREQDQMVVLMGDQNHIMRALDSLARIQGRK